VSPAQPRAGDHLSRLLAMVPYLTARQGVPLAEAARHFDISEEQLVADLELLFVCGTPGHMPDDLIEADWESGSVYLTNADAISRPLRLGLDEAVALLAGLRTLADARGVGDSDALDGARAKLSAATGDAARVAGAVRVDLETGAEPEILATCRQALRDRRRLHLRYLVTARDEATERDVDPMRLVSADGRWYLEGWCHRVEDVRLFRLDRVLSATLLDADGTPPGSAVGRDLDDALFRPGPDDQLVTLDLQPEARWVAEYYPVESTEELPGDRLRVRLRTADAGWLRRLVLKLGGWATVVEPASLAQETAAAAESALRAYAR
jgi:predicted DNA-binding transcriptional regulator YafY